MCTRQTEMPYNVKLFTRGQNCWSECISATKASLFDKLIFLFVYWTLHNFYILIFMNPYLVCNTTIANLVTTDIGIDDKLSTVETFYFLYFFYILPSRTLTTMRA